MGEALPSAGGLDVGALSRLFDETTNSYKHLLVAALLEAFRDSGFRERTYSLDRLAIGMLAAAWHPCRLYRLSLGARDGVGAVLASVDVGDGGPVPSGKLFATLAAHAPDCSVLLRWVPYRLLTPFFADRLRGLPDQRKNAEIVRLADTRFDSLRPLYRLDGGSLEIHPDWAAYLAANFPIVEAWAERKWIAYLQARNPTVPAISEKVRPPGRREPLKSQTGYWRAAITAMDGPARCIYTGTEIDPSRFHLDHFLPWTFVCHDALWNLVPVDPSANSSKRDRLPDPVHLPSLVEIQHRGLKAVRSVMTDREWENATIPFVGDLRIPEAMLLDRDALAEAYDRSVRPQLDIARGVGFEWGWRYRG